jgi:hypothetical protein
MMTILVLSMPSPASMISFDGTAELTFLQGMEAASFFLSDHHFLWDKI